MPPGGHVLGIYARTDIARGVHRAPANEEVRGIITDDLRGPGHVGPLEFRTSKGVQDILNPRGINVMRDFRADQRAIRVWGARTMADDPEWKYVNVRRLFIFLEEWIHEGTQFVVFEPNNEATWAIVRRSISSFLTRVWRDGALMGATPEEAFFVKCDRTTMTQDDLDNGRLICLIGVAPVKPAEFVIFRFSQKTLEAEADYGSRGPMPRDAWRPLGRWRFTGESVGKSQPWSGQPAGEALAALALDWTRAINSDAG